jgi:hypothetical protein
MSFMGKISGPLLKENLIREGIDLAFETDLIYLDVINRRVGIKTNSPTHDLTVNGTTRTENLEVTTSATIGDIFISGNQIYSNTQTLNLAPPSGNYVVYQDKLLIDDIKIEGNSISTINSNSNLELVTSGTGKVNVNADMEVFGNIHATGTITADGSITLGNSDTDTIDFNADIASNIIPDVDDTFQLGTATKRWKDIYVQNLDAANINTGAFEIAGIDITLQPGNTYYVGINGDDGNTGLHQNDPLSSIGRALDLATAGDTVYIYPGTYSETMPLVVPAGVNIKGTGIRSVTIQPDSDVTVDVFLLNGETTVEDLTITGFEYDSATNTGYAFRFAPGMTVTSRSPYIRNVTVITAGSTVRLMTNPVDDPRGFLSGDAGKGAYLDGSVVNAASREASCLFHSVTFICPGVDTITAINGVRIEWLNCFTYFADRGLHLLSGTSGFAGDGKTRVKITNKTGTFNVGNTLTYYDTDGTTVLASGVIESIDGDFYVIDSRVLGFETPSDRDPKTVTLNGDAKLSTAQKKFGVSSLVLDGVGDYITIASQPDFAFGTADFTLDLFWRPDALGTQQVLLDMRTTGTDVALYLEMDTSGNIRLFVNGSYRITSSAAVTAAAWNHITLFRTSGVTKLAVNGTITPTTYADSNNYGNRPFRLGADYVGSTPCAGYFDEVRVVKGAAKYTTSVTVPTVAFNGDSSTVLLLHFEGTNNSTLILDDGITLQDIRTSAGGTSSIIDLADYSDFGVEIRSIGSANVYGNYGVYGDGAGVLGYLIGQNFAYIGSGRLSDNDPIIIPNDSTNVAEVVQFNDAKIYYTSVDNKGDFKVGDFFKVDQEDGSITFNASSLQITSPSGVVFTDGVNTTTIVPTYIETGNIKISGNTIESTSGGITLQAANNQINTTANVTVTGNLTVNTVTTLSGDTVIGDNNTDTFTVNAAINSDLIPTTVSTKDLGSAAAPWRNVHLSTAILENITISGNVIQTTDSNSNLELRANGTGQVLIPSDNLTVNQNLNVSGTSIINTATVSGTLTVNSLITNSSITFSTFNTGDIQIDGNVIRTTLSNSNLELRANGTGYVIAEDLSFSGSTISGLNPGQNITLTPSGNGIVEINSNQALKVPVGTQAQRPTVPQAGMVRYNTTINQFEGYNGSTWSQLGGVIDNDRNTYIVPEITPGANDNTLYFVTNGVLAATLNSNAFSVNKLQVDDTEINGNVIRTTTTNADLQLLGNGTGGVLFDNLKFANNSITNVSSGAVTEFKSTGTGYYHIVGTSAFVIPTGVSAERPGSPVTGMMRYNIDQGFVEIWNGTSWGSVAGATSGITLSQAQDIAVNSALIFG